jgi:hypothetical protein
MFCHLCKAACSLRESKRDGYRLPTSTYCASLEDLKRSKDKGCLICFRLWNSLVNQQIEVAFSPDQAPDWRPGDRTENYNIDDFYGILAIRDYDTLTFKCRNVRSGYTILLSLNLDNKDDSVYATSSDRTSTTTASEESLDMIRR